MNILTGYSAQQALLSGIPKDCGGFFYSKIESEYVAFYFNEEGSFGISNFPSEFECLKYIKENYFNYESKSSISV